MEKSLYQILQQVTLFLAMFAVAVLACAGERDVDRRLQQHFEGSKAFNYRGYESVQPVQQDQYGYNKYMVLDFRLAEASGQSLQRDVQTICGRILRDIGLVSMLSDQGYDMISVSFDRRSQYDCL